MTKKIIGLFMLSFIITCSQHSSSDKNKGFLLIVGGGKKPAAAMEKFIELCGNQKILIITSASADPVDAGEYSVKLFKKHGAKDVDWLNIAGKDTANTDSIVNKVKEAQGIYFTGGVQGRFMNRFRKWCKNVLIPSGDSICYVIIITP